ncbi:hypothetical protein OS493_017309 [Desmophyllum pertusum]|uniref:Uncharacterized protein n=1 Tax=Desmophyllum pertusum TaxID=174260 RepID=A0A9X0A179_9CNID|nr:hypothetical protein OS493_017309 [Desmophyllum pertusum]
MAVAKTFLFVCVSLLAHIAGVFSQSQFLRWCVQENGMCHQNWECCDKMFCSDHFGIGKCIPLTSSIPIPAATWPQTYPYPWQWPPYWPLKPKKKKKKKKKKIIIRVCGDLMGLNVKAKKKNSLFRSLKCKQKQGRIGHN